MKKLVIAAMLLPCVSFAEGNAAPVRRPPPSRAVTAADLQGLEDLRKTAVAALGITNAPRFDLDLIAKNVNALRLHPYVENGWAKDVLMPAFEDIKLSPADMAEIVGLCIKAADIFMRVSAREEAHRRELAARGVAEVPASTAACRFRLDAGKNSFLFDKWGELQIDRRFLDKADMDVIRQMENCYRRIFCGSAYASAVPESERKPVARAEARKGMPWPWASIRCIFSPPPWSIGRR